MNNFNNNSFASKLILENIPFNESGQLNSDLEIVMPRISNDSIVSDLNSPRLIKQKEKFKLVFIGNPGVGKSTLIHRLIYKTFNQNIKPTTGYEISLLEYERNRRAYTLNLWDSSGDEKYEQILKAFYRDAHALVLVFDLSNEKSFEDLEFWLNQGREFICTPCIAFLIGLKCDLPKVIEEDLVKDFWISEKLEYYECSNVTGEGCEDLLGFLVSRIENNRQSKMFLSTEGRITMGVVASLQTKREYLCSSEHYFAKKNTFLELKTANPPAEKTCNLI